MRVLVAATVLLAAIFPAHAAMFDEYRNTLEIFNGGTADVAEYTANFRKQLFDGLDGRWFMISALGPTADDPALFAKVCDPSHNPTRIEVRDEYSFEIVFAPGTDRQVRTIYSSKGGNVFGSYTDPVAHLRRLGGKAPPPEQLVMSLLANINGTATMARPAPDILVVQTDYQVPWIFARCAP